MVVLRASSLAEAMSFIPVMAMVENTVMVAPPRTHWGMVVSSAENLGDTPASSKNAAARVNTVRLTTLLVVTIPTFWE